MMSVHNEKKGVETATAAAAAAASSVTPCTACDAADMHSERVFNQIQRFYRAPETPAPASERHSIPIRYTSAAQMERMKTYSNCDFAASRIRDLNNGYIPSLFT